MAHGPGRPLASRNAEHRTKERGTLNSEHGTPNAQRMFSWPGTYAPSWWGLSRGHGRKSPVLVGFRSKPRREPGMWAWFGRRRSLLDRFDLPEPFSQIPHCAFNLGEVTTEARYICFGSWLLRTFEVIQASLDSANCGGELGRLRFQLG